MKFKIQRIDPQDEEFPSYGILTLAVVLSGRVHSVAQASAIVREFYGADLPYTDDATADVERDAGWFVERLRREDRTRMHPDAGMGRLTQP